MPKRAIEGAIRPGLSIAHLVLPAAFPAAHLGVGTHALHAGLRALLPVWIGVVPRGGDGWTATGGSSRAAHPGARGDGQHLVRADRLSDHRPADRGIDPARSPSRAGGRAA